MTGHYHRHNLGDGGVQNSAIIEAYRNAARFDVTFAPASSYVGEWLSLVEHLVRDQGVGGSNPLSPTIYFQRDIRLPKSWKFPP